MVVQESGSMAKQRAQILQDIQIQTAGLLGFDNPADLDVNTSLLEIGADSIAMMQAVTQIKDTYGVQIAIRQFFEDLTTLEALATYIAQNAVPELESLTQTPETDTQGYGLSQSSQVSDWLALESHRVPLVAPAIAPSHAPLPLGTPLPTPPVTQGEAIAPMAFSPPPMTYSANPPVDSRIPGSGPSAPMPLGSMVTTTMPVKLDSAEWVIQQQLQVMAQQLALLGTGSPVQPHLAYGHPSNGHGMATPISNGARYAAHGSSTTPPVDPLPEEQPSSNRTGGAEHLPHQTEERSPLVASVTPPTSPPPATQSTAQKVASPGEWRRPRTGGLTPAQKQHIQDLTARFTQRTKTSKQIVNQYRPILADSRASVGFRPSVKEMLYPIVADRSSGSHVWDVDGNEYVDLTMGQGVLLFGHQPDFIMDAVKQQMAQGIQLHPRHHLVGEVAQLICELTGVERVCFSNSGTEAMVTAVRLVRAAMGRDKIAIFEGAYHGHGDCTLVRNEIFQGERRSVALAPGIPQGIANDVVVLNYNSEEAIAYVREHGHELAAVLVEPIQSNNPTLQPKEFLRELRQATTDAGTLLLFDEITTGFRSHPGGIQALFDVKADVVAYGKVVGGGMPIGIIAGRADILDHIDGGMWNYGDNSFPAVERTFFGGTFCMHPLAMAATHAVLTRMKAEGPALQERLNQKVTDLAATLNQFFQAEDVPIEVEYFSSFFRFAFTMNLDPFFFHLVEKGVYVWEWRKYFMSTAHTDTDIEFIIQAVKDTIWDMRAGGFFHPSPAPLNERGQPNSIPSSTNGTETKRSSSLTILAPSTPQVTATQDAATIFTKEEGQNQGFWQRRNRVISSGAVRQDVGVNSKHSPSGQRTVDFSLFYFGNYSSEFDQDKYRLLFEGARFADQNGFAAVWLPERHFHQFGGFSPNPSVLCAALARETKRVQLRAGSVVLPLHHPIRVAEQWSIVDNLSQGRVGIAFASGWHENDFIFAPDVFGHHRELTFQNMEVVQRLWQGESVKVPNGSGNLVEVEIFPQPMQKTLPSWLTIVSNPDTYRRAGAMGVGVLTNLMAQKVDTLAQNLQIYRRALVEHGHDPASGHVTVLLHTLIGNDLEQIRQQGRQPMYNYMTSSIQLFQGMMKSQGMAIDLDNMTDDDRLVILEEGYKRYVQNSALIGTPESCKPIIDHLIDLGVDEIACLVDFGADDDVVIENFPHIDTLRQCYVERTPEQEGWIKTLGDGTVQVVLTEAQRQLWVLDQLEAGADNGARSSALAYVDSFYVELRGEFRHSVMVDVLQQVSDRHSALRTRIHPDGQVQEILPMVTVKLPIIDFSSVPRDEQDTQIDAWIEDVFRQPFDLSQAPLFQAYVLKLANHRHRLVAKVHHIIADGWSVGLMLKEIGNLYTAYCQGQSCELPPTLQFSDYVVKQLRQQQSGVWEPQEQYWLQQFADSVPTLNLPTDRPYPPRMSYRSGQVRHTIDAELGQAIKHMGGKHGCTLLMTLLSAYKVLLHRLSAETDIVVGIPTAGRGLDDSEDLMGYCVHLLPIRSQLQPDMPFADYLKAMRGKLLDAYENADYPFAHLLNQLDLNRDFSRSALVSAAFNLDLPLSLPPMGNLEAVPLPPPKIPAPYDIYITVTEVDRSLQLDCSYNQDVLDGSTVQRWLGHFETLLSAIATDPTQALGALPLLTAAERQQALEQGMGEIHALSDRCLHQLIEQQALQTPDTIAVVFENQTLTYTQLNQRANQLAHYLQALGVGTETLVGLCLERSIEMAIAVLAVMKAGGAYVPLDPTYPMERIAFMVQDAAIAVLLTQPSVQATLPGDLAQFTPAPVVSIEPDWSRFAQQPDHNPASDLQPSNLAYVIYTSGSTGQPKGVAIAHVAIVNYVHSMIEQLALESGSRFAYVSTISADLGHTMLFPALCSGGTLHILPWHIAADSLSFGAYLQSQQIDYLKIVPSHLAALQDPNQPHQILPRKALILGGEATPVTWVQSLLEGNTGCTVYNHYGPTETTVGVLTHRVDPNQWPTTTTLPLDCPVHNTQIYLLDEHLNPVPTGVYGEIHIGGSSLAQGYLNQPDLTAQKFISNPFKSVESVASSPLSPSFTPPFPSDRLYKTGDLARYWPNGQLEFLGRADQQVKINGFRIELKDIETQLCQHPDVRDAAVITRDAIPSTPTPLPFTPKQVVAYIVAQGDRAPLANSLPRYQLPNNLAIAHLNKNETDYIYREIFELQAYRKYGITVQPGDCIVDVGANIGLFSLFNAQTCPGLTLYAFEPNPTVFNILRTNLTLYGDRFNLSAKPFNCGLAAQAGTAEFTFFPGFSLLSGFYADADTEREVVKNFVKNQGDGHAAVHDPDQDSEGQSGKRNAYTVADGLTAQTFLDHADDILAERFQAETFTAQLRTLSEVIAAEGIEWIDLLKINVEKSEWDVLSGIRSEDWDKIRQLVVEVDVEENLQPILTMLQDHGFETVVDQDALLTHTELCYVYAIRPSERGRLIRDSAPDAHRQPIPMADTTLLTAADLREFIRERLPEQAWPTAYVFLESLPLTPNGKLDYRALPAPDRAIKGDRHYVKPNTDTERVLAEIWQAVLNLDRVGLHDNFFEIGGNSLLLIQAHRALQERLQLTVPVVDLFGYPTIKVLAEYLTTAGQPQPDDAEQEKVREDSRRQGRATLAQRRQARQRHRR